MKNRFIEIFTNFGVTGIEYHSEIEKWSTDLRNFEIMFNETIQIGQLFTHLNTNIGTPPAFIHQIEFNGKQGVSFSYRKDELK